jgi:hypothetical protein
MRPCSILPQRMYPHILSPFIIGSKETYLANQLRLCHDNAYTMWYESVAKPHPLIKGVVFRPTTTNVAQ